MDDPLRVRLRQRLARMEHVIDRSRDRQRAAARANDAEIAALELVENDAEREGDLADAPNVEGRAEMLEDRINRDPEGNA